MDAPNYDFDGDIFWGSTYFHARRPHGPAIIRIGGNVFFTCANSAQRDNGPARVFASGSIEYTSDPRFFLHRTDGPALIQPDGTKEYWVEGSEVSPTEFFILYGKM